MRFLHPHIASFEELLFSPTSGELLSLMSDNSLLLYDLSSDTIQPRELLDRAAIRTVSAKFFPDGKVIALAAHAMPLRSGWNHNSLWTLPLKPDSMISASNINLSTFFILPDGKTIIGCNWLDQSSAICRIDVDKQEDFHQIWTQRMQPKYTINGIAPLVNPSIFVSFESSNRQSRLAIRRITDGEVLRRYPVPNLIPNKLAISDSGEQLFALSDMAFVVFDTTDWKKTPRQVFHSNHERLKDMACHPSGRWLAVAGNDKTVKIYETFTLEVAKTFTWNTGRIHSIAFSPDGLMIAAGSDNGKIVIWDFDE